MGWFNGKWDHYWSVFLQTKYRWGGLFEYDRRRDSPSIETTATLSWSKNNQFRRIWLAQDGAPPHRRRFVTDRLAELFGDRVIALNHVVEWPPRSPDLTPLDFFLRGYLKSKVYQTPPANLEELEQRIRHEIDTLRQDRALVRRAVFDMLRRVRVCSQRNGGHVED